MQLTYIFALLFAVIVAVFAIVNSQPITVDFLFNEFEISLALIILISAFAGAIILGLLGLFKQIKFGFRMRDVKGRNKKLEAHIEELENSLSELRTVLEEKENSIVEKERIITELKEKPCAQHDVSDNNQETNDTNNGI